MIRYKDKVYEDYFIDPVTAVITDKDGNILEQKTHQGRPEVRLYGISMRIHIIQANTYYGYKEGYDVHHIDENPLNNALSNLKYMTPSVHRRHHTKGKRKSEECKEKLHNAMAGRTPWNKGVHYSPEFAKKVRTCGSGKDNGFYGKHQPDSAKLKLKEEFTGSIFWNNGIINKRAKECPR